MYYDATTSTSQEGYDLRQFRSLLVKRKVEIEPIITKIKRKIFINIEQNSSSINFCKLFLKTHPNKYGSIQVYVLYKKTQQLKQLSKQFVENIIFAFTEKHVDRDSQYIEYIDLSLIQDFSTLNIVSHLNPSVSVVYGVGDVYYDLPVKLRDFIFNDIAHLDFSNEQNLFEDYLKQIHNIKDLDERCHSLSNSGSSSSKSSQSHRDRNWSMQNNLSKLQRSITLKGCNLMKINNKFCQNIPLIYLDISGAQVPSKFLNNLQINDKQQLRYLNISYTKLQYNSIEKYFSQEKPATYLQTFICRGLEFDKIFISSITALFKTIIKQNILKELEVLDVSENEKVNDDIIEIIQEKLLKLHTLKVSNCDKLETTSHEQLCKNSKDIKRHIYKLDYSKNVIQFSPIQPNVSSQSLKSLDITNCTIKDIPSFYSYLSIQTELYKLKLDYSIFQEKNFQFLAKIFNTCKQLRKIYVFLKPAETLDLKSLQIFISKEKSLCSELNIYFFKPSDNQKVNDKQQSSINNINYLLNHINEVNEDRFVNIHLGKFSLVNKQQMKDINLSFNYKKLSNNSLFYFYIFNKCHFCQLLVLINYFIQQSYFQKE